MSKDPRVWLGRVLSVAAVLVAGILSGWMFTSGDAAPSDQAEQPSLQQPKPHENRLGRETSPYLQLHKHNPIDWYPWGSEALEKANREGKLIFLSIGYSSCYWCHVMERESFNDAEIASVLNESFVCIKVDREELPDVDEVFMTFVQMSNSGHGGWPLSVFLTPDAKPFFGRTYFPPRERDGLRGFLETLETIKVFWRDKRTELEQQAAEWTRALQVGSVPRGLSFRPLDRRVLDAAIEELANEFDPRFGGFGFDPRSDKRPKFPQSCVLELLCWRLAQSKDDRVGRMLTLTLHRLNEGGIWDSVGGGFHRYSVDRQWRIPHFEKMLYDNALLARVYLEAFSITNDRVFSSMARRIFRFVANELTSPDGGFYSALDAESEHEEGKYYVWSKQEVRELLDPFEYEIVSKVQMRDQYRLGDEQYVLQLGDSLSAISQAARMNEFDLAGVLEQAARKLLVARSNRQRPLLDTKVLTDWNGLMIAALADGYRILGDETYRDAAERAASFLLGRSRTGEGRLAHVNTAGASKIPAYLEDYAALLDGLIALHRATHDDRWLEASREIADEMHQLFWDESDGGYYRTALDREVVLTRVKTTEDSAVPSGNSTAALALVRLAQATGEKSYAERAGRTFAVFAGPVTRAPGRWPRMVRALGEYIAAGYAPESLPAQAGAEPEVVRAMAVLQNEKVAAGDIFTIEVPFEIDPQWHIYANPSSSPQFPPTTLRVASELPLRDVTVQYPRSRIYQPEGSDEPVAVYSDRARMRVTARVDSSAPTGRAEIQLALQYQACNDERCMAPRTIRLTTSVEIVGPNESPAPPSSNQ